jgi:hypothetical protein
VQAAQGHEMTTTAIPNWTNKGVLPPVNPLLTTSAERSPYRVKLLDVVMLFATSSERFKILRGFLDYRAELHGMALVQGFQWLNGSFSEHVEVLEMRPPKDIDVVSFVDMPPGFAPTPAQYAVLDHDQAKVTYWVDSYFVEMNLLPPDNLIKQSTYWYSLWSHRRTQEWKGYLEIDLSPAEDASASAWLNAQMAGRGAPW